MLTDWDSLPHELQLALTHQAMAHAARIIAEQAEMLAEEMENGALADRGGASALRLLATVARATAQAAHDPAAQPSTQDDRASLSKRVH